MKNNMKEKARIKYVKKANQWCKTTFTVGTKGNKIQKQEWFNTKEEAHA